MSYEEMLARCEENTDLLSNWERQFIESIRDQVDRGRDISERQGEVLERIAERL